MIAYLRILLRMRNVLDKSCRGNKNVRFMFEIYSGRLWNDVEKYGRGRQISGGNIKRRMRFACRLTKATDTLSKYAILITFPQQQWWRERVSMLLFYGNRPYGWDWWTIVIILACFLDWGNFALHLRNSSNSYAFTAVKNHENTWSL
jgi:hypothetical protein